MKNCELQEYKECNECGACELCDTDKEKICDNCCNCIEIDSDYKVIEIEDIQDGVDHDFSEEEEDMFLDWVSQKIDRDIIETED
ncbi:hypothetical protein GC105_05395 [Alkalibaculum sp. M08DMB]|uniref:Uncharacterized protein n=1 Tax=Alkalibaculum sporogenes TaxID=2655001 RepID=A0A6A7K7A9_9FIRM|nr:hypothetical protein [Alkalibaculum sporogenes]MPW25221.1 hypothetical protein [Alkalibaculum sporogenes]